MKVISKFFICLFLAIGAAACLPENRREEVKPANNNAVNAANVNQNTEVANRNIEPTQTVVPPAPDTLTVALSRKRGNKTESVTDSEIFKKDDGVRLKISVVEFGFVTVIYRGSNNKYMILFPNKSYNDGKNSIVPNWVLEIPDRGWLFFDGKKGVETVFAVYSKSAIPQELTGAPQESFATLEKLRSENNNANAFTTKDGNLVRFIELKHE